MAVCTRNIILSENVFTACGDMGINLNDLLTTDISSVTSLNEFNHAVSTEFIMTATLCGDYNFINKNLKIELSLEMDIDCSNKQFQDGEQFQFQDGNNYNFNQ